MGKSCLLKLVIERLRAENVNAQQIVYINKESMDYDFIRNYQDLHAYVKKCFADVKGLKYLGDIGIRHAILGFREGDISGLLENLVFLELKLRG
ncbi:MAG: hypothetical protein MUO43_16645 [Desulfobacterales bacterium]|nr:hypothetical protein [Desulfobacterales bacterium]